MKGEPVSGIQPNLLKWARESANMTAADVADKLKKPVGVVDAWEAGSDAPTYSQLETLAYDLYKRPLAMFFLPNPPDEPSPKAEFRSLPERDLSDLKRDTVLLIRRARAFQFALAEVFDGRSPAQAPLWRSVRLTPGRPIPPVATRIRVELGIPFERELRASDISDDETLKMWRRAIEARGIFVFKHTFKQSDISGFCLRHAEFPVIMINNSTTKTRQIFSLLHELAHLLADRSGISSFDESKIESLTPHERGIEVFCNAVAAEVLVPMADFRAQIARLPAKVEADAAGLFATLASRYHVSRAVVLRRLLDDNRVSRDFYETKTRQWDAQKGEKGSGGNYYATQNAYLSERFLHEVFTRYARRQISRDTAAELVGIAPKNLARLEDQFMQGFAA
jgi:Zn-dependent peptidase ImmA (M78 family)